MAGEKVAGLYGGEDEYGKWGDTWDTSAEQQQMKASGSYDKSSDLAKQFSGLKENISSRVDNEDGWRQIDIDGSLKDPKAYQDLVNKWSGAGFDIRAIDMGDGFHSSNIAVRVAGDKGTGIDNPAGGGDGGSGNDGNPPSGIDEGNNVTMPGFPSNPGKGGLLNSMIQNVTQDNDITNNISGDNNTVENTQDNSVSQSMGSSAYVDRAARGLKDKYVLNLLNR